MAQGKVVITGATGHLGSSFLIDILQSGYTAHIVVRSESKAKTLQEAPAIASLNKASSCKYFIVPDLAVPGALDEAAVGTDFFIHCASPLPTHKEDDLITPSVDLTLGALESARRVGTVKRVVVLSSVAAFVSPELVGGDYEPPEEIFVGEHPNEDFGPPYINALLAYCAAKTAAFRRSLEWMEDAAGKGVNFDLINLAPAYCFGRHPLATSVADLFASSNGLLLQVVAADAAPIWNGPQPAKTLSTGVLLKDIVRAVHTALDLDYVRTPDSGPSKGVSSYVMGVKFPWNDAYPITARKWPDEVKKGLLAGNGDRPSKENVNWAMGRFHETFEFKLRGLEDMLDDLIPQYLELLEEDKSKGEVA